MNLALSCLLAVLAAHPRPFLVSLQEALHQVVDHAGRATVAIRLAHQASGGTGFIITPDGFVLTNYHVAQNQQELVVELADRRQFTGRVVGYNKSHDLAMVKIASPTPLPWVSLGDSAALRAGSLVVAIGNPFGYKRTVSFGIVSHPQRVFQKTWATSKDSLLPVIQTDAAINPGNSGGPLLNMRGEVVGVNTAITVTEGMRLNTGLGFSVPSHIVKRYLPHLMAGRRYDREDLWTGMFLARQPRLEAGAGTLYQLVVKEIEAHSPADRAGLEVGDVLETIEGKSLNTPTDLSVEVASHVRGEVLQIRYHRGSLAGEALLTLAPEGQVFP